MIDRMRDELLRLPRGVAAATAVLERGASALISAGPAVEWADPGTAADDDPAADALELARAVVADRRDPGDAMRAAITQLVGAQAVRFVANDVAPSHGARLSGVAARAALEDAPVTGREAVRSLPDPSGRPPAVLAVPHGRPPDRRIVVVARAGADFTPAEVARVTALLRLGTELDLLAAAPPPVGRAYPHSWRRDAVLADGTEVHLRPVRDGDDELVAALHARCSPATIFARFLSPVPRLPRWMLARLVEVDHESRVAVVAVDASGNAVGLGSWSRQSGEDEAELALLVEDAMQGKGLGPLLVERLLAAAAERGLSRLDAVTSPGNAHAMRVLTSAGFVAEPGARADGLVHLTVAPALALARPA